MWQNPTNSRLYLMSLTKVSLYSMKITISYSLIKGVKVSFANFLEPI